MTAISTKAVFIDDNEAVVDLLHYEAIASTVVQLVNSTGDAPVSIGVHGDWGAGKSTVLALIEQQVQKTATSIETGPRPFCIRFNGWQYQGFEDTKAALLETIITKIRDSRPPSEKVKAKVIEALKQVDYLKLAKKATQWGMTFYTGIPHPEQVTGAISAFKALLQMGHGKVTPDAIEKSVNEVESLIKPNSGPKIPEHIDAFKKEFRELISAAEISKLIVLVDDLDRCLPSTVIDCMEAIRLFLFTEHTAFVVAADEAMVQYAVKQHFPDLPNSDGPRSYALNYLEKLIQVPFRIPPLGSIETQHYIILLLAEAGLGRDHPAFVELLKLGRQGMLEPWKAGRIDLEAVAGLLKGQLDDAIQQVILHADQLHILLARGTEGNPRQVKRFLNALLLRREIAKARGLKKYIKLPILAKLMLAEYFKDDFYGRLEDMVLKHTDGMPEELVAIEASLLHSEPGKSSNQQTGEDQATKAIEWKKDEWVHEWAAIKPFLSKEDLRPYFFISRDKKMFFPGLELPNRLLTTVDLLMGRTLATIKAAVTSIDPKDALQIAAELRNRILSEGDFDKEPRGMVGLQALAEHHPQTRAPLLGFLKSLPVEKLGGWAGLVLMKLGNYPKTGEEAKSLAEDWKRKNSRISAMLAGGQSKAKGL